MRRVPNVDSFLYYLLPEYEPGTFSVEFEPGITNRRGTPLTGEMQPRRRVHRVRPMDHRLVGTEHLDEAG